MGLSRSKKILVGTAATASLALYTGISAYFFAHGEKGAEYMQRAARGEAALSLRTTTALFKTLSFTPDSSYIYNRAAAKMAAENAHDDDFRHFIHVIHKEWQAETNPHTKSFQTDLMGYLFEQTARTGTRAMLVLTEQLFPEAITPKVRYSAFQNTLTGNNFNTMNYFFDDRIYIQSLNNEQKSNLVYMSIVGGQNLDTAARVADLGITITTDKIETLAHLSVNEELFVWLKDRGQNIHGNDFSTTEIAAQNGNKVLLGFLLSNGSDSQKNKDRALLAVAQLDPMRFKDIQNESGIYLIEQGANPNIIDAGTRENIRLFNPAFYTAMLKADKPLYRSNPAPALN